MIQTLEPEIGRKLSGRSVDHAAQKVQQIQPVSRPSSEPKQRLRLGCAGLIRRGESVLLGKRNKEPNRGLWVLPGGGVEFCESFAKTLERELLEEAGIQIDVQGVFNVFELINPPNEHRVIVYMNGSYRCGEPSASSDLSEIGFFHADELNEMSQRGLISPFVEKVLREAALLK
ncbi:MAG: NUDIX domain-containing protein [Verrucomicrobiota bacterium]|jgi:8-oxo-dGTP diphosphatase